MEIISLGNHLIRKALRLSLNEMAVLCQVHRLATPRFNGWCIQSKSKMADFLDFNPDTVFKAIKALEAKGYIERNNKGYCKPSLFIYDVNAAEDIAIYIRDMNAEMISFRVREISDSDPKHKTDLSEFPTTPIGKTENDLSEKPRAPIGNSDTSNRLSISDSNKDSSICPKIDFGLFWKAYPNRKKRQDAEKAWNKLKSSEQKTALEKLPYFLSLIRDKQYIPLPTTFINGKRWQDEDVIIHESLITTQKEPSMSQGPVLKPLDPSHNKWAREAHQSQEA
jgi:hypothetical protein